MSWGVGSDVEVAKFPGRWYPAQILEGPRADGAFKVHFKNFGESWDDWVESERIRQSDPAGITAVPPPSFGTGASGAAEQISTPIQRLSMRTSSQLSAAPPPPAGAAPRHPYDADASRVDELTGDLGSLRKMLAEERRHRVVFADQVGLCQRQAEEERETRLAFEREVRSSLDAIRQAQRVDVADLDETNKRFQELQRSIQELEAETANQQSSMHMIMDFMDGLSHKDETKDVAMQCDEKVQQVQTELQVCIYAVANLQANIQLRRSMPQRHRRSFAPQPALV
eukprot:SAG31_NODE_3200_length_4562_cov_7.550955_6_plen_283_part_00